ncbi:head maturation protease, ClpP-related [Methylobacterium sp. E-045]|uniref:head maturation protease, ClpP-related n=1 Tax=Methylobacterium sp. E-045 TaxID=2836575 RepID=UPI001FBA89F1|nr:head maturation protease, ClpP-related [Methylobacterium sp. E-045]MCJ2132459.1 Clp protease ClpP [Methylobacterium sp. E-045]
MADEKQTPAAQGETKGAPDARKGKGNLAGSQDLGELVKSQRPRGMIGRVRNAVSDRPGPLPVPAKRNVSAFTPPDIIDRWNKDAAGVKAVETGDNVITMFGMVGEDFWTGEGITAKRVAAQLRAIGARPVEVHINSFGGDVFEGIAVYNTLREHPFDVTVKVMGIAASAASVITMAGDTIEIGAASFIMIHNCSVMGGGNRQDFLELAAFLEPFDRALADVYAQRTGIEAKTISKMMDDETYMSGSVAIEKGFADALMSADKTTVDEGAKAQARDVNALRGMERQLVASGMSRVDARDHINKIRGMSDSAPEASMSDSAGAEDWSDLSGLIAAFRT